MTHDSTDETILCRNMLQNICVEQRNMTRLDTGIEDNENDVTVSGSVQSILWCLSRVFGTVEATKKGSATALCETFAMMESKIGHTRTMELLVSHL